MFRLIAGTAVVFVTINDPGSKSTPSRADQVEQLAPFNALVGEWRGIGQVRRFSNRGAWSEKAEWLWHFDGERAALRCKVTDGDRWTQLEVIPVTGSAETFDLVLQREDEEKLTLRGKFEGKRLIAETPEEKGATINRITLTLLNDKRTVVLWQTRKAGRQVLKRVVEVGYTRKGTRLTNRDSSGPECIVTGGDGTMPMQYKGKTYYVCCTGCRQAFEEDPEGVLAEWAKKKAERKKKSEN